MKRRDSALLVVAACLAAAPCLAQDRVYVHQRDLLTDAIRQGEAAGVMQGEVAEHFTRELRSTGTLRVQARVVQELARDDCRRLEVRYTQEEVPTPQGVTQARLVTRLDYCLDGGPPAGTE